MGGETNVVSVRRPFYPLQRGTDILFNPQRDDQTMSLRSDMSFCGNMWGN
jgi:hypothetical protein